MKSADRKKNAVVRSAVSCVCSGTKQLMSACVCVCDCDSVAPQVSPYLSMMTGSEGVSLRFPQLFLSQHRLEDRGTELATHARLTLAANMLIKEANCDVQ